MDINDQYLIIVQSTYIIYQMNNFRNMARKWQRDTLERNIISSLKSQFPNFDQYVSAHRYPTLPKIILYSSSANSESFFRRIFPFYNLVTPTPTAETDEIITRRIAEQLTSIAEPQGKDGLDNTRFGYVIRGFPFNVNQALLLDRYLNGVNLAIHLKSTDESADFASSVKPLLNYYNQRGTLLELSHSNEPTINELENAFEQIKVHIKRSV